MSNTFFQLERKTFQRGFVPYAPTVTGLNVPIQIGKYT